MQNCRKLSDKGKTAGVPAVLSFLCIIYVVCLVNLLNAGQTEDPKQTSEDRIKKRCMVDYILDGPQDGSANRVIN